MKARSLLVLLGAVCSCVGSPLPVLRDVPSDVDWVSHVLTKGPDDEERRKVTRFVGRGAKWRLDVMTPERKGEITVFDGTRQVSTTPGVTHEDPRVELRRLYANLPGFRFWGEENVKDRECRDRRCWYFSLEDETIVGHLWIDVETHLPRRRIVELEGIRVDEFFAELPDDFQIPPRFFAAAALEEKIRQAREAAGDP
ncbi:MAG: hypothetical protein O7J95_10175 [Planctomycetota bacterium]|nr:hypothetical protein [Planctomycetota bacterium]